MCRIAGFEIEGVDVPTSAILLAASFLWRMQAVRGPRVDRLLETRLSVIDLSAEVAYPMGNERGEVHLSSTARSTTIEPCAGSSKLGAIDFARAATPKSSCTVTRSAEIDAFPRLKGCSRSRSSMRG